MKSSAARRASSPEGDGGEELDREREAHAAVAECGDPARPPTRIVTLPGPRSRTGQNGALIAPDPTTVHRAHRLPERTPERRGYCRPCGERLAWTAGDTGAVWSPCSACVAAIVAATAQLDIALRLVRRCLICRTVLDTRRGWRVVDGAPVSGDAGPGPCDRPDCGGLGHRPVPLLETHGALAGRRSPRGVNS